MKNRPPTVVSPWPPLTAGARQAEIFGVFAKARIGRSMFDAHYNGIKVGDLVVKKSDPSFVGRVTDTRTPYEWPTKDGKWRIRVRPIHEVEGRNQKKSHWCAMRAWKAVSPLELLATQGDVEE